MAALLPRINLVLDWDGTTTTKDTTSLIGESILERGYQLSSAKPVSSHPGPDTSWQNFVEAYLSDFKAHKTHYRPVELERKTVEQELEWLQSLRPVEEASYRRVQEHVVRDHGACESTTKGSMIAKGKAALGGDDDFETFFRWKQDSERPRVRLPGQLLCLLDDVQSRGGDWGICSVSWSRSFVYGALQNILPSEEPSDSTVMLARIRCNEINETEAELDPRFVPRLILTAHDKRIAMEQLLQQMEAEHKGDSNRQALSAYVGDSCTDLDCLLKADIGIFLSPTLGDEQRILSQTFTRCNVPTDRLSSMSLSYLRKVIDGTLSKKTIWWIERFEEITQCEVLLPPL